MGLPKRRVAGLPGAEEPGEVAFVCTVVPVDFSPTVRFELYVKAATLLLVAAAGTLVGDAELTVITACPSLGAHQMSPSYDPVSKKIPIDVGRREKEQIPAASRTQAPFALGPREGNPLRRTVPVGTVWADVPVTLTKHVTVEPGTTREGEQVTDVEVWSTTDTSVSLLT
jgi:hypothetical protein